MNNKEMKNLIKKARKLAKPFRVTGDSFRLKDIDPGDTLGVYVRGQAARQGSACHGRGGCWPSFRTCSTRRTVGRCC